MYKVKRLAIMLGRSALPTCFSIECQGKTSENSIANVIGELGQFTPAIF